MNDAVAEAPAHAARPDASVAAAPLLLVYQMAKVASLSWLVLGRRHVPAGLSVHVHFMAPEALATLERLLEMRGPGQTIARPLLLRDLVRGGSRARRLLEAPDRRGRPTLVITGMRDPVARSISAFFFLTDFYGRRGGGLSWREGATIETFLGAFLETWERLLAGAAPDDSFDCLTQFTIGGYRSWLSREIIGFLGFDLLGAGFVPGPAERILTRGDARLLVYRVEDMAPGTRGHDLLRASVEAFCGWNIREFPRHNATDGRKSGGFHQDFLARLRMPRRLLARIYDDAIVRYFYAPDEIDAFMRRWAQGPA